MLQPDFHLGGYRLISRLGAGGMGEVWKAEDTRLGRAVAIKILPPELAAETEALARLRREARTAAQLSHPNIATIHALDETDGRLYLVMELVEGEPLSNLVRRGPVPEADVCRIGKAVAEALAEAHAKGVVHRDIKPDNIVVNGPRVKVLDFGIARRVGPEAVTAQPNDPTAFRTQTGYIVGTPNYMSPEQALGRAFDHRTDIFSLGVVLYELATGRLPFRGETVTETILKIARDEPEPMAGLSTGLRSIVERCLRKDPSERFATAGELAAALDAQSGVPSEAGQRPTPHRRAVSRTEPGRSAAPRGRWPSIAVVCALSIVIALVAIVAFRPRKPAPAPAPPPKPLTTSSVVQAVATTSVEVAAPATTTPTPPPEKTADDFYNEGIARLVERQPFQARAAFEEALQREPDHAKAHFRLGVMALFGRDFAQARRELEAALAGGDRLELRERKLAELGLALLDRDRPRAEQLLREIAAINPRDPDLMRFRELIERNTGRPFRGRKVRPD